MNNPVKLGVIGSPVSHSLSPVIHQQFANQFELPIDYQAYEVSPSQLTEWVTHFAASGGQGLNITLPHKQSVMTLCQTVSSDAEKIGAVNTLKFSGNEIFGDNTDSRGFINDCHYLQIPLTGKNILLLGAGGAARAVATSILQQKPAALTLVNRTRQHAEAMAVNTEISVKDFAELDAEPPFDVIINATSASLSGIVPPLPTSAISAATICYDLVYSKTPTAFLAWAAAHGAVHLYDGLGMLVEQAALSFQCWFDRLPETTTLREQLRHG